MPSPQRECRSRSEATRTRSGSLSSGSTLNRCATTAVTLLTVPAAPPGAGPDRALDPSPLDLEQLPELLLGLLPGLLAGPAAGTAAGTEGLGCCRGGRGETDGKSDYRTRQRSGHDPSTSSIRHQSPCPRPARLLLVGACRVVFAHDGAPLPQAATQGLPVHVRPLKAPVATSEPRCPSVPCSPHARTLAPSAERRFPGCFQRCLRMRPRSSAPAAICWPG
jgi:hypothetical protein